MKFGICQLCHKPADLCRSHIVPKLAVKPLKAQAGYLLKIHGKGTYGLKKEQDGFFDFLLCKPCELFCSAEYEDPFVTEWDKVAPRSPWIPHQRLRLNVDYRRFKLFHLLNLYRASVCTLREFDHVRLGVDEEPIRRMLLSGDPGEAEHYSVGARVLYMETDGGIVDPISQPERGSAGGRRSFYSTRYYGREWTVFTSPGGSKNRRSEALKSDGTIIISGRPWGKHWFIRHFATNLAGKKEWSPS